MAKRTTKATVTRTVDKAQAAAAKASTLESDLATAKVKTASGTETEWPEVNGVTITNSSGLVLLSHPDGSSFLELRFTKAQVNRKTGKQTGQNFRVAVYWPHHPRGSNWLIMMGKEGAREFVRAFSPSWPEVKEAIESVYDLLDKGGIDGAI